jgi:hypothetical protein
MMSPPFIGGTVIRDGERVGKAHALHQHTLDGLFDESLMVVGDHEDANLAFTAACPGHRDDPGPNGKLAVDNLRTASGELSVLLPLWHRLHRLPSWRISVEVALKLWHRRLGRPAPGAAGESGTLCHRGGSRGRGARRASGSWRLGRV